MRGTAVIPGSFDPITNGHVELVRRALRVFDRVTLLVCQNFDKEYLFTAEERLALAKASLEGIENVSVEYHDTWLFEYLRANCGVVLVKGVRNEQDFLYEQEMAKFNFEKSGAETLLFFSSKELSDVSSSRVRELLNSQKEWRELIPQNAQKLIEKFYAEK